MSRRSKIKRRCTSEDCKQVVSSKISFSLWVWSTSGLKLWTLISIIKPASKWFISISLQTPTAIKAIQSSFLWTRIRTINLKVTLSHLRSSLQINLQSWLGSLILNRRLTTLNKWKRMRNTTMETPGLKIIAPSRRCKFRTTRQIRTWSL